MNTIIKDSGISKIFQNTSPDVVAQVLSSTEIKDLMGTLLQLKRTTMSLPPKRTKSSKSSKKKKKSSSSSPKMKAKKFTRPPKTPPPPPSTTTRRSFSPPLIERTTPLPPEVQYTLTNHNLLNNISEIKVFKKPPRPVKDVMNCVLILLKPTTKPIWSNVIKLLHKRNIMDQLWNFNVEQVRYS